MSSAVEAPALATPPPGLPPGSVPSTEDPGTHASAYGRFRFDPGDFDVSNWDGRSPSECSTDDEGSPSSPDAIARAGRVVAEYRKASSLIDSLAEPLRRFVARVLGEVRDAMASGMTADGIPPASAITE